MKSGLLASPDDAFGRALDEVRSGISTSAPIAIAYSGGLDSSALLHLMQRYAQSRGIALFAFHIHHGISGNADGWLSHCQHECARLGIRFEGARVLVRDADTHGVEAAARSARYAELGTLCRRHRVALLLTAHHRDDQAETVLLQLLRGAGIAGLSGMETANTAPQLLGYPELVMGRPLLGFSRAELAEFVAQHGIAYVDDESNSDVRYARNALRHHVTPALIRHFPGFQQRLVRAAAHAGSAQRLLDALAAQDLAQCRDGDCIDMRRLQQLDGDRIDNLLRFWLASRGIRMPSTSWLAQMREQLFAARDDAQVRVTHADCEVRRYRDRIYLTPRRPAGDAAPLAQTFQWEGQATLHFGAYGGTLHFDSAESGADAGWLRAQRLQLRLREGGETIKPAPDRSTRSLKHHYQSLDIPAWERERLPLVTAGGDVLFAAAIGMNWRILRAGTVDCIRLRWEPDASPNF